MKDNLSLHDRVLHYKRAGLLLIVLPIMNQIAYIFKTTKKSNLTNTPTRSYMAFKAVYE